MEYIKRMIEKTMNKEESGFPVIMISGAREIGKTTLLQLIKDKNMNYVTLDDLNARTLALSDPKYFLEQYKYPLIIDEIQHAPILFSYIKMIVDNERYKALMEDKDLDTLFWLISSQRYHAIKNVTESLAGRIGLLDLYSLSLSEISQNEFSLFSPKIEDLMKKKKTTHYSAKELYQKIFNGGMPCVVNDPSKRESYFATYINRYIEQDVKQFIQIEKTIEFYSFLQYIAARTAQEINYAVIARDVGVDSKTIKSWIEVLEATGIVYLLQPYFAFVPNRIIRTPKLYFMDTGLCSYLAKYPTPETLEVGALSKAIFETYVVSEIIKNIASHGGDPSYYLSFYRDKDQYVIDLLYQEGQTLYPINITQAISPLSLPKKFTIPKKISNNVAEALIICMTDKLMPINKNCWLCPIEYI